MKISAALTFGPLLRALDKHAPALRFALRVQYFRDFPEKCFAGHQQSPPYAWPKPNAKHLFRNLDNIIVSSLGLEIGWVKDIRIDAKSRVATIGHFATDRHAVRMGLGRKLALELAHQLKTRYKVSKIVFSEQSPRHHDVDFFTALGAVPIPKIVSAGVVYLTPDWHWKLTK
jgi:ribosomal protein S18 acetylase RimI-like enzyme